jgi:hypothetical protein
MSIEISQEVKDTFKKFRTGNAEAAAMVLKVTKDALSVDLDEYYESATPEEVAEDLSLSAPRFIVWSYKITRADGRTQFPLCLVYYSPTSGNPAANMLYTRAKPVIITTLSIDDSKVYTIQDAEDLTADWLHTTLCKSYTR